MIKNLQFCNGLTVEPSPKLGISRKNAPNHELESANSCIDSARLKGAEKGSLTPLGITAKYTAPSFDKRVKHRSVKSSFQAQSSKTLTIKAIRKMNESPSPKYKYPSDVYRTIACNWNVVGDEVSVMRASDGTGHYKGIFTCGSVWACPICAAKIQERRREEIAQAMSRHYESAGQCVMVTLTAPHYSHQSLDDLRSIQREALKQFRKSSGSFTRFLKSQLYIGLIRALEVTVSERNGWHLHTHELWFMGKDADIDKLKSRVLERWEAACVKAGFLDKNNAKQLIAFRKHSVDIKANAKCSDYLAKQDDSSHWGADREIAKSSTKSGKLKGYHPFALLGQVIEGASNSDWCEDRFGEYVDAMKGARQLYWSRGLKDFFGIGEKTDEQLAAEEVEPMIKVASIDKPTWRKIREVSRTAPLDVLETAGVDALNAYIESFRDRPDIPEDEPIPINWDNLSIPEPLDSCECFDIGFELRREIKSKNLTP